MRDADTPDRPVTVQRDGPLVTLVLARPERRNPLSLETMELLSNPEFVQALRTYEAGETKWTSVGDLPE